jgi:hypothetical protein
MAARRKFSDHIREIVDEFLQTVVIVDDRALPDPDRQEKAEEPDEGPPDLSGGTGITELQTPSDDGSVADELPAREVIGAFAARGLVCAILHPDDAVDVKLVKAAARADLLVVDWVIHDSHGTRALELIADVLRQDEQDGNHRLRVIAVYTGQSDLGSVADALEGSLANAYQGSTLDRVDGALSMTKGPVRLTVFAKEHVKAPVPGGSSSRVKFEELPERLASEFMSLTQGLVSGVALGALSALRKDTHRILDNLGPDLDAGYLGHRVAQMRPIDAELHLTDLVAAEFRSILADAEVGGKADLDAIRLWLTWTIKETGLKPGRLFEFAPDVSRAQLIRMLKDGLGDDEKLEEQRLALSGTGKGKMKEVRKAATKMFSVDTASSQASDGQFSARMMLRTIYGRPRRELHLGTIVFLKDRFLICVQPVCDSVRLDPDQDVAFPFLLLAPPQRERIDLIVPHPTTGAWTPLALTRKPNGIEMIIFRPTASGVVPVYKNRSGYHFKSTRFTYRWVADLKPEFAHRVANELGQQFSRIGLDEPELLRLSRG